MADQNNREIKTTNKVSQKVTDNEDEQLKKDIENIFDDEAIVGVLDPSEASEREPEKESEKEPPKIQKKIKREVPKKIEEKNVNQKKVNVKKTHVETPEELEKRLLQELYKEMNEGEVIGVLDLSATPQGSRSPSKASK